MNTDDRYYALRRALRASSYSFDYPTNPAPPHVASLDLTPPWTAAGVSQVLYRSQRPDLNLRPDQPVGLYFDYTPTPAGSAYAELTFPTTGQDNEGVRVYGYASSSVAIYLDGELVAQRRLTGNYTCFNFVLVDLFGLSAGTHTVRIVKLPVDSGDSSSGVGGAEVYTYSTTYP